MNTTVKYSAIAVGVLAAIYGVKVYAGNQANSAAADQSAYDAQNPANAGSASSYPNVLFTSGTSASSAESLPATTTTGGASSIPSASDASLAAIAAALSASSQGTIAAQNEQYNTNASSLFGSLAKSLSDAGLTALNAVQSQDASGSTILHTDVTYREGYVAPTPATTPAAPTGGITFGQAWQIESDSYLSKYGRTLMGDLNAGKANTANANTTAFAIQAQATGMTYEQARASLL